MLGQVGGFPLRLSWFPRLVEQYHEEGQIPHDPEKIACALGIGKNMAKALRFWAIAAGVIDRKSNFKPLAHKFFIDGDRFLAKRESITLLHWLISSNVKQFTANTWLFNYFRSRTFTLPDAMRQFSNYLVSCGAKYADGTIKVDIETAVRMYASVYDKSYDEVDDRFFYPMMLISKRKSGGRMLFSRTMKDKRHLLSSNVLTYSLLQTLATRETDSSTLTDLYIASNHTAAPGTVFGLTQDGFYTAVERITSDNPKKFALISMPGGEFSFRVNGRLGKRCQLGDQKVANDFYFGTS